MSLQMKNEASYEFAQTLLKFYSPAIQKQKQSKQKEIQEVQETQDEIQQKMDAKEKYSLNYEKFDKITDQQEKKKLVTPEEEEMNKLISQNPYLQQIACTHDRRKERELYEKSTKEKLDNAEYFKNEGNRSLKDKEYEKAAFFYQKALIHFDYAFPDTEDENKRFDQLKEQCHNNMAQCKFLQKDFDEALTHCSQVLKMNPCNAKAIFRKAKIFYQRDLFDDCGNMLLELEKITTDDQDVLNLKAQLKKKVQRLYKYYLQRSQAMKKANKICVNYYSQRNELNRNAKCMQSVDIG